MRNPKDVLMSYFHFSKMANIIETVSNLDEMLDNFLTGRSKENKLFFAFPTLT